MQTKNWVIIIAVLIIAGGLYYYFTQDNDDTLGTQTPPTMGEQVTYTCANDSAFQVAYGSGESEGIAMVTVEGDMVYTLERVPTATGIRYANANDDFVFTLIDNTATIEQLGEATYQGCGEGSQLSPF